MGKKRVATNAEEIRPGEIRSVGFGVPALVAAPDKGKNGMFLCIPLAPVCGNPTSNVVSVGDSWHAKIVFGAAIYPDHIGVLLGQATAEETELARKSYWAWLRGELPHRSNSEDDWTLYHKMVGRSMERFLSLEADTYVFVEGEAPRRETKQERRNRLQRRRRWFKRHGETP